MRTATAPQVGRRRVAAVVAGLGLAVASAPAVAAPREDPEQAAALVLLADAAQASRSLSYTGTQYVATWGSAATSTTLVEVQHAPGRGAWVRTTGETDTGDPVVLATGVLHEQLLDVLSDRYVLRLAGEGHCTGRVAHVVEVRRPGTTGASAVAGRFWIDRETGLLLRREVFDGQGRRLRSSAFLDLAIDAPGATLAPASVSRSTVRDDDAGEPVPEARLRRLREGGQAVPERLPGGFALFDVRSRVHGSGLRHAEVLHLAYSDGLSTISLFSQPGELGSAPPEGFGPRTVGDRPVWVAPGDPQRMVWAGGGRVWTLVSDAPDDAVALAVAALPHQATAGAGDGWRARLARGAARLAAALNPFSWA